MREAGLDLHGLWRYRYVPGGGPPTDEPCAPCHTPVGSGESTPTPPPTVVIPTETLEARCDLGAGYIDWRRWYPLFVGQGPGQRAVNWFSQPGPCSGQGFNGLSLWDYPAIPATYPGEYGGECIDYYWLWGCMDPGCPVRPAQ